MPPCRLPPARVPCGASRLPHHAACAACRTPAARPVLATIDLGNNKLARLEDLVHCAALTRVDVSNNDVREVPPHLGLLLLSPLSSKKIRMNS